MCAVSSPYQKRETELVLYFSCSLCSSAEELYCIHSFHRHLEIPPGVKTLVWVVCLSCLGQAAQWEAGQFYGEKKLH